jgi:M3 family oligoendopeptidase
MKFSEIPYVRPDVSAIKEELTRLVSEFQHAKDAQTQISIIKRYHDIMDEFDSYAQLAQVRHSINTKDEFYDKEQEFLNETGPEVQEYTVAFSKVMLESKFRSELEKELGSLLFEQAELAQKVFSPTIIPDLQEENRLTTEYGKLTASAQIEFDGGTYNLSQMRTFATSTDRNTRHRAQLAVSNWFASHEEEFDHIYDQMVKVRTEMAKKIGYDNYVQMGYDRFSRLDYNSKDVKGYRDQVYKVIVPYVQKLQQRRAKRIGVENLKSYDLSLSFLTGNPTPKGDRAWQVERALKMYDEMSPETSKFFRYMLDRELLDLDAKPGKEGGGYCTYLAKFEAPFIFANFNGTSGDVDVLTHEAGHAFQVFTSRNQLPEYRWPTMESAEIHSMSMEFLAWPWIHYFFEGDTDKYKFDHLAGAVEFLPYGVLVDEYQHVVYENPNLTPEDRKRVWRNLEKKYLPWKDYDDDTFMERGTFWFRQGHIFQSPFYYIDYTLAQVVAFQFWAASRKDHKAAWQKYYDLCKLGGSKSFVGLLNAAKLDNPFMDGTIEKTMEPIKAFLDSQDDSTF